MIILRPCTWPPLLSVVTLMALMLVDLVVLTKHNTHLGDAGILDNLHVKRQADPVCPIHCKACDRLSPCTVCDTGWYENDCSKQCPVNCDGECNRTTGSCTQCKVSYYGDKCEKPCPQGCRDNGHRYCDKRSGRCYDGCQKGRYGDMCNLNCSSNCISSTCFQDGGKCSLGCAKHHHGHHCNNLCSAGCQNGTCHQDGACNHGCTEQTYGSHCRGNCSYKCLNSTCYLSKDLGIPVCSHGCVNGWMDDNCEKKCPDSNCVKCEMATGVCISCQNKFYSNSCDRSCEASCLRCDKLTGECRTMEGISNQTSKPNISDGNNITESPPDSKSKDREIAVGITVTVLTILIVLVLAVYIRQKGWIKRICPRRHRYQGEQLGPETSTKADFSDQNV